MWYLNKLFYTLIILLIYCHIWYGNCSMNEVVNNEQDLQLTVPGIITQYGYICETHEVVTEDGYVLTILRIPFERISSRQTKKQGIPRQPVLLVHGIMGDSGSFFFKGNESLPFLLATAGYDVWLVNLRGSFYSLKHVKYKPSEKRFWKWSWGEMAAYDLPATLKYISSTTKEVGNILYVGYSMGTTVFLAAMSSQPKHNSYVKAMFSLAPVAYMNNIRGLFAILKYHADLIYNVLVSLEIETSQSITIPATRNFLRTFCKTEKLTCSLLIFLLAGFDSEQLDTEKIPFYASHIPSSSSLRTLWHYVQLVKSTKFQHFDHGSIENLRRYGQSTPPVYNISKITVPIALYWGKNDFLDHEKDTAQLWSEISNKIISYEVPHKQFNHFDFIGSRDVKFLLYDKLLEDMKKFS